MDVKKPCSFQEQLDKLKSRNCVVKNEARAQFILQNINYYRLTAYFLPFKQEDGTYKDGTTFENVYRIYEFDRKSRKLVFGVISSMK